MQLMATRGLEHQTTNGLGWVAGDVVKIRPDDPALKIPHMAGTPSRSIPAIPYCRTSRQANKACTPISCTPTISSRRYRKT